MPAGQSLTIGRIVGDESGNGSDHYEQVDQYDSIHVSCLYIAAFVVLGLNRATHIRPRLLPKNHRHISAKS
jgi:hypothetical protein